MGTNRFVIWYQKIQIVLNDFKEYSDNPTTATNIEQIKEAAKNLVPEIISFFKKIEETPETRYLNDDADFEKFLFIWNRLIEMKIDGSF